MIMKKKYVAPQSVAVELDPLCLQMASKGYHDYKPTGYDPDENYF